MLLCAHCLDLETSRVAATASAFVLATSLGLGGDLGGGVLAVDATEVTELFAGVASTLQQNSLGASGALEGELVKSQDGTTSLLNTGTSGFSNVEGSNGDLWDGQDAVVISDGADDYEDDAILLSGSVGSNLLEGHRGAVVARQEQATQDNLVEAGLSATSQELVQLSCSHV